MIITNHRLDGVNFVESPNHGGPFAEALPDTIIIHFTAGGSAESSVSSLCNPASKASAHVVVGRDGSLTQLVPFNTVAWHAGQSSYGDRVGFNKYSIGIEIDNAGRLTKSGNTYVAWFGRAYPEDQVIEAVHRNETRPAFWHRYTEEQISTVYDLCELLVGTYGVNLILGHEEISPGRKTDPGPAFPLDKLRERILRRDRSDDTQPAAPFMKKPGVVSASKLNIRSSPRPSAPTVALPLLQGTMVDILQESNNGWCEVAVPIRGWVKKEFVSS